MSVHLQLAPYAKSTGANLESKDSPLSRQLQIRRWFLLEQEGCGEEKPREKLVQDFFSCLVVLSSPRETFQPGEITIPSLDHFCADILFSWPT